MRKAVLATATVAVALAGTLSGACHDDGTIVRNLRNTSTTKPAGALAPAASCGHNCMVHTRRYVRLT